MYFCSDEKSCFYTNNFNIYTIQVNAQIVINEYSAANYDTSDNYTAASDKYNDWVELYNPTATPIDISGWYLTDKPANPTKWEIPSSFVIPANGFAVIYCSGRDEITGLYAHSNFKITQTKGNEVIMLKSICGFQDSVLVLPNQISHKRKRNRWCFKLECFYNRNSNSTNTGQCRNMSQVLFSLALLDIILIQYLLFFCFFNILHSKRR